MIKVSDLILILVAILFPPAAAAVVTGCSCDLLINILLTILGYIPGHISANNPIIDTPPPSLRVSQHALWLIYKKMQAEERYGQGGFQYVGSGQYEPLPFNNSTGPAPNYGATGV